METVGNHISVDPEIPGKSQGIPSSRPVASDDPTTIQATTRSELGMATGASRAGPSGVPWSFPWGVPENAWFTIENA